MTATTPLASATTDSTRSLSTSSLAAWALRRALIGMLILTFVVGGSAWLLHASIDPTAELPASSTSEQPS